MTPADIEERADDAEDIALAARQASGVRMLEVPSEGIVLDEVVVAPLPGEESIAPGIAVAPCRCGSIQFVRAPIPFVHVLLRLVSVKRRYRCAECHAVVWRHRMLVRARDSGEQMLDAHAPLSKEVWFFVVLCVAFVLFLGTVMKECADAAPPPPADVSQS